MKRLLIFAMLVAAVGCMKVSQENVDTGSDIQTGVVSVRVRFDDAPVRSQTTHVESLEQEKAVRKVCVMVFDKESGLLNSLVSMTGDEMENDACQMYLPVGDKVIYAIVNGPDPDGVSRLSDVGSLVDEFSVSGMNEVGLTLVGQTEYEVKAGNANEPATVTVGWLASRVVLSGVSCNIPEQHGNMSVDCVYLGNAHTAQTFGGVPSEMRNVNGLSQSGGSIGIDGETGDFASYMYRSIGKSVDVGENLTDKYYMYCQPNSLESYTCLYLLVTIGGQKYYYRVPLTEGLQPNTTCSVDLRITNLGSPTPPDGDMQKGEIEAEITFDDWLPGNHYVTEF